MFLISILFVFLYTTNVGKSCNVCKVSITTGMNMWQITRQSRLRQLQMNESKYPGQKVNLVPRYMPLCHLMENSTEEVKKHTVRRRYIDLKGKRLRIGAMPWPERLTYNATTSTYAGYNFDLLVEISQLLNFTFSLVQPKDYQWGIFKNNTWSGLVGMLVKKELDFAIALANTPERASDIDFACHIYQSDIKLWMLDPRLNQANSLNSLYVLSGTASWCLLSAYVVVVLVYSESTKLLSKDRVTRLHFLRRFYENCFLFIRPLLRQGALNLPLSTTGRTLLSSWWWFSIILSVMYSGTMVASLAGRTRYPFTTVKEMLSQEVYKWGYVGNSSIQSFIEGSKERYVEEIGAAVETFAKTDPAVLSSDKHIHQSKMKAEKYIFIGTFVNPTANDFRSLRETLAVQTNCIGLPRNSPLTNFVQNALTDLDSFGIMDKLSRKNSMLPSLVKNHQPEKQLQVSLDLVQSAFYMTSILAGLSGLVLVLEFIHAKFAKSRTLPCAQVQNQVYP